MSRKPQPRPAPRRNRVSDTAETATAGVPSAETPHVRVGGAYFCPGDGYAYPAHRQDGAVARCLGCGAPVTEE